MAVLRSSFPEGMLAHGAATSIAKVAGDLSVIFKVRRHKMVEALAEEFVSLYKKC